jgi:hypothetical protein
MVSGVSVQVSVLGLEGQALALEPINKRKFKVISEFGMK